MKKRLSVRSKKRGRSVVMPPTLGFKSNSNGNTHASVRLRMRPWMEDLLNNEECQGLKWVDRSRKIFSIVWRHASSNGFNPSEHGDLFYRWADHTGKLKKNGAIEHTSNKSTFRCALHSLKDCIQLTKPGDKKGEDARRTYQFIEPGHPLYDSKRKGRRQRKVKAKINEEILSCKSDTTEHNTDTWDSEREAGTLDSEQNTDFWNYTLFETEEMPQALGDISASPTVPTVIDLISLNTSLPIIDSSNTNFSTGQPSFSLMTAMSLNLSGSTLTADPGNSQLVPKLEALLPQVSIKNTKIVAETQPDGVIALQLHTLDASEGTPKKPVVKHNFLPVFSELGVSEYESSFYHAKLSSGGRVKVQKSKQVTLSQPEFVIDPSKVWGQHQQTFHTFSELDNGSSVEIGLDGFNSNSMGIDRRELTEVSLSVMEFDNQNEPEDIVELQPLADLDDDNYIDDGFDHFIQEVTDDNEDLIFNF